MHLKDEEKDMTLDPTGDHGENIEYATKQVAEVVEDEEFLRRQKSLVRKLDMTLMPMIFILYLFNYLDRNNIA